MNKVVYLTGAPATGKSTLAEFLTKIERPFKAFVYSKELLNLIKYKDGNINSQDDLRMYSASVITPNDILDLDKLAIQFVANNRASHNIVIDTHAVTKESYGFRITPYNEDHLVELSPDILINLYSDPETIRKRISRNNQGRPLISVEEAQFHTFAQTSVAISYAVKLGVPLYCLESSIPTTQLANRVTQLAFNEIP